MVVVVVVVVVVVAGAEQRHEVDEGAEEREGQEGGRVVGVAEGVLGVEGLD